MADPVLELSPAAVVHQLGKGSDVLGGSGEGRDAPQDLFELLARVGGQAVGVTGEPL
ncbi:hypothetical protein AB0I39_01635 [Kitasatospora purpeofusca]|uniref:hypothetical protein n=1 Tax=Kitasatospora purpeofusca TaxID=67352 RepID=UPI0034117BA8